ncbi:MAG: tetratricopeptide repeat protein [Betaproteobacteria bacterium]|nr:tetratricopeptide repeat protein [Betaproteobacteria bacterium]
MELIPDTSVAIDRLRALLDRPDHRIGLAEAALIVASQEYPGLDIPAYIERLDLMGEELKARMPGEGAHAATQIRTLNRYLFDEQGFSGNAVDYYDPRNSYLNEVLDRKTGVPITLSIVYMEVGRRAGLHLEGVAFPGHFLVKCVLSVGNVVLDPFGGGQALGLDDLARLLSQVRGGSPIEQDDIPTLLDSASNREILARLLRNLKGIYLQKEDLPRALAALDRMLLIFPEMAQDLRDRGLLHLKMECFRAARDDLGRYLDLDPEASDRGDIIRRISALEQIIARLN